MSVSSIRRFLPRLRAVIVLGLLAGPSGCGGGDSDSQPVDTSPSDVPPADVSEPSDPGTATDVPKVGDGESPEDVVNPDVEPPDADPDAGEAPDAAPLNPDTVPLRGACPIAERLGGFVIEVQPEYSFADGKVADGVNPISVLDEVATEGGCRLLHKEFPFCDPLCQPGFTCAKGGECVPFPENQDVGTVTIKGLVKDVELEPKVPGLIYFDVQLPHPAFEAGAPIHLTTTLGWAGELDLYGVGSDPIQLVESQWSVQEGKPLSFSWDAPKAEVRSHVAVFLNIDQHGNSPVTLHCEFEDTGSASLPATLIDALLNYGVSGYPNAMVTRRTADRNDLSQGCVDLLITTPAAPSVEVSGHYPCSSPLDCPDGLDCNLAIETCE